ncbi:MAG TPA: HEAT repeat domain-containing protein, partial [Gemmatimonadales bacterium]
MRHAMFVLLAAGPFALPAPGAAQTVATQIDRVRDGTVRLSFDTRPEICGDGRSIGEDTPDGFVLYSSWNDGYSMQTSDHWMPECRSGPLRLVVVKSAGRVHELRAAVGVEWRAQAGVTDLGTVAGVDAATWLLDVAARGDGSISRIALLAANAAQGSAVADRVIAMIRNRALRSDVRQAAMRWVNGMAAREGKADAADRALRGAAADQNEYRDIRDRAVRQLRVTAANDAFLRELYSRLTDSAVKDRIIRRIAEGRTPESAAWVRALAQNPSERGELRDRALRLMTEEPFEVAEVRDLFSRLDSPALQDRLIRTVAEWGRGQDREWVMTVARDTRQALSVRDRAIRVLAERADRVELRELYGQLHEVELRERVLRGAGDAAGEDGRAWLRSVVLDPNEHPNLRDRALRTLGDADPGEARRLFDRLESEALQVRALRLAAAARDAETPSWLEGVAMGQSHPPGVRDWALRLLGELAVESDRLADLYDRADRSDLRQRVLRLLAERADDAAVEKLIAVAVSDPDPDARRFAVRRLSESRHPRARAFLEEHATRPR